MCIRDREIADGITDDIQIYVLANEDNADTTLDETLKKYEDVYKRQIIASVNL